MERMNGNNRGRNADYDTRPTPDDGTAPARGQQTQSQQAQSSGQSAAEQGAAEQNGAAQQNAGASEQTEKESSKSKLEEIREQYPNPFDLMEAFLSGELDYAAINDPAVLQLISHEINQHAQFINFLSNISKAEHDASMAAIRNMV